MNNSTPLKTKSPSQLIDGRIRELDDWRGGMLDRLRTIIKDADPDIVEEWKWRGVLVWSHDGIICTGETYKTVVKMTIAEGASLPDPSCSAPTSKEMCGAPSTFARVRRSMQMR